DVARRVGGIAALGGGGRGALKIRTGPGRPLGWSRHHEVTNGSAGGSALPSDCGAQTRTTLRSTVFVFATVSSPTRPPTPKESTHGTPDLRSPDPAHDVRAGPRD